MQSEAEAAAEAVAKVEAEAVTEAQAEAEAQPEERRRNARALRDPLRERQNPRVGSALACLEGPCAAVISGQALLDLPVPDRESMLQWVPYNAKEDMFMDLTEDQQAKLVQDFSMKLRCQLVEEMCAAEQQMKRTKEALLVELEIEIITQTEYDSRKVEIDVRHNLRVQMGVKIRARP